MRYIVQRPLKSGNRTLQVGDEVPDAGSWRNLGAYLASGHIVRVPESGESSARLNALEQRVVGLETLVAHLSEQVDILAPVSGDGSDPDRIDEEGDTGDSVETSGANQPAVTEPIDLNALERQPRAEIDAQAVALGIEDAPKLGSKAAVTAAIRERETAS